MFVVLTDTGEEVVKPVLGEQRVLQTPEVELQHSGDRVDVVVALLIDQRVVTWTRQKRHPQIYVYQITHHATVRSG